MTESVKAVIFDFDGVIHNTFELAYTIHNKVEEDDLTREEYKDLFNGNIYNNKIIDQEHINNFFREQDKLFKYLRVEEDVKSFLEVFSKEYTLFIISSNQESTLNMYLDKNNLEELFKEVLGRETHKSKVEKFKIIFKKYNLSPDDCIFVTDTLGDILEANEVGVKTIAVDFGFHQEDRLRKGNPLKIISSIQDVALVVNNINKGIGD